MNNWQPIETAPLLIDILVFHKEHGINVGRKKEGILLDPLQTPFAKFRFWVIYKNDMYDNTRSFPTHWMPLPEPPK